MSNSLQKHVPLLLPSLVLACAGSAFYGCSSSAEIKQAVDVGFDDSQQRVLVLLARGLGDDEQLLARVKNGKVGELDCGTQFGDLTRIDGTQVNELTFRGPLVDSAMFEPIYDNSWIESEPTAEMIAAAQNGSFVIEVCIMSGTTVRTQQSFDIRRAMDRAGSNGKFDGNDPQERISSTAAYAERCIEDLGEIPFFENLGDGDYGTYNCLDSTPIPTTVTAADGTVTLPTDTVYQCDNPQYIYSSCERNAVDGVSNGPRVTSASNEKGTHWVLLCRKAQAEEGSYNDIAMIGSNPYTGKTCFFQNALYTRTDGINVPHPGDKVESDQSPQQSASLWQGIHGGLGSGIQCAECHSTDAFVHTPWIDAALDAEGDPIVPKMGVNDDFVLGYNDAPYSLINAEGQGWRMPKHLVSPEANACTRCHRIGGNDKWMNGWTKRLVAKDATWTGLTTEAFRAFEHSFWMPPDVDGLDETTWADSELGKAVDFILACGNNPEGCEYSDLPTEPVSEPGTLPEIDLEGTELATSALVVLGADVNSDTCEGGDCNTRRCAECHSLSRSSLTRWLKLTNDAWNKCGLIREPNDMTEAEALTAVNCLRVDPEDDNSVFEAAKLGVLSTGVQYTDFRRLFQKAYGDGWLIRYSKFKARVSMPKGSHPKLSQKEYATLFKWFRSDLRGMESVLNEPPPPQNCTDDFDAIALNAHIDEMEFEGWEAINQENGIRMFGCTPDADPTTCFQSGEYADREADWGNGVGTTRELMKLGFRSSFWTRSSADGRYVGNGGGNATSATISDLQTGRDIAVRASYDPGFFPDNSGFMFQGSVGGAGICSQSILDKDDSIDFSEASCMKASGINLYQHVARGVGGGDYFVINSQFTSDSGRAASDPAAHFNGRSTMKFSPMLFNGITYEQLASTVVDSPYEGDSVLSPSGQLVASRLSGPGGRSLGYVVRKVKADRSSDSYNINIDEKLATVCTSGAKVNFSFDERFMATHHYENGTANIILIDLLTGERHQVTDMPVGTYAQFPHFRSDGWMYYLVTNGTDEYVVANDAAVVLSATDTP